MNLRRACTLRLHRAHRSGRDLLVQLQPEARWRCGFGLSCIVDQAQIQSHLSVPRKQLQTARGCVCLHHWTSQAVHQGGRFLLAGERVRRRRELHTHTHTHTCYTFR